MRIVCGILGRWCLRYGGISEFPFLCLCRLSVLESKCQCTDNMLFSFLIRDAQEDMQNTRLKA